MAALLAGLFLDWLFTAMAIYVNTLGPEAPSSPEAFLHDVFATPAGHALIVTGMPMGFPHTLPVPSSSFVILPCCAITKLPPPRPSSLRRRTLRHVGMASASRRGAGLSRLSVEFTILSGDKIASSPSNCDLTNLRPAQLLGYRYPRSQ